MSRMNPFVGLWSRKRIAKRGRLTSCMILIALVMAPLVCALIFSDSMMEGITSKYIYLSDGHIQLNAEHLTSVSSLIGPENAQAMVVSADEVTSGYALMYSATNTSSVMIKGVSDSYFNDLRLKQITFMYNENPSSSNIKGIAISRATARKLDVGLGDRVALMIVPDDVKKVLRPVLVRIDAIFYSGYDQLDELLSFIDLDYARELYSDISSTTIELLVTPEYMERLDEVVSAFGSGHRISKWNEHNVSVYENFVTSRQMIMIILMLVTVVAAFYTASVAQQMVQDDIQEIAIVKLVGSSNALVRKSAFISVYTVTLVGMVMGICLGLLIGCNLGPILTWLSSLGIQSLSFYLLDFSINIPWLSIGLISLMLMVISFISIHISLSRTRHITPMRLFTTL